MFSCFFKKAEEPFYKEINTAYKKLREIYEYNSISEDRKKYLKD